MRTFPQIGSVGEADLHAGLTEMFARTGGDRLKLVLSADASNLSTNTGVVVTRRLFQEDPALFQRALLHCTLNSTPQKALLLQTALVAAVEQYAADFLTTDLLPLGTFTSPPTPSVILVNHQALNINFPRGMLRSAVPPLNNFTFRVDGTAVSLLAPTAWVSVQGQPNRSLSLVVPANQVTSTSVCTLSYSLPADATRRIKDGDRNEVAAFTDATVMNVT